jgi:hypothetical protein
MESQTGLGVHLWEPGEGVPGGRSRGGGGDGHLSRMIIGSVRFHPRVYVLKAGVDGWDKLGRSGAVEAP